MFNYVIEPGLELRLYQDHHVDEVFAVTHANRDHLARFMPWIRDIKSADDERAFFKKARQQLADNNGFQAGIWECDRYIGGIGFHWIKWNVKYTEIGYWLAREAQGRGIMTKACRAMVNYACEGYKLNKVEIRCDPENARSRAIPKRLGFVEEGTLRQVLMHGGDHGQFHDAVVYGMLSNEWAKVRNSQRT